MQEWRVAVGQTSYEFSGLTQPLAHLVKVIGRSVSALLAWSRLDRIDIAERMAYLFLLVVKIEKFSPRQRQIKLQHPSLDRAFTGILLAAPLCRPPSVQSPVPPAPKCGHAATTPEYRRGMKAAKRLYTRTSRGPWASVVSGSPDLHQGELLSPGVG